jgi:AraC-like DNA-binding protein
LANALPAEERRAFYRSPHLPGFELMEATSSSGSWAIYNLHYAIAIPDRWAARVVHEGRSHDMSPGHALLVRPGEFHSAERAERVGDVRALVISNDALIEYAGEYVDEPTQLSWRAPVLACSSELVGRFLGIYRVMRSEPTAMQIQSAMAELFAAVMPELVADKTIPNGFVGSARAVGRMRELIHDADDGATLGLDDLANAAGMTRFQALRAFKKYFGVPPYSYQLVLRINRGMSLLRRGHPVSAVAHELGFSDQSHFTRHFKKTLGVTPGEYLRGRRAG